VAIWTSNVVKRILNRISLGISFKKREKDPPKIPIIESEDGLIQQDARMKSTYKILWEKKRKVIKKSVLVWVF